MNTLVIVIVVYLAVANIAGFSIMGIDKMRAKEHKWRVPERVLFEVAIFGGSVGCWAGMYVFRHKTKHWYFVAGMPAILVVQIAVPLIAWFVFRG